MSEDARFCSICQGLLLKQDRNGFVLIIQCDQCGQFVHEKCYLEHHQVYHDLIGIILEF